MEIQLKNLLPCIAAALAIVFTSTAYAADLPKRKAGLWELHTHMEGLLDLGTMQQCVDEHTDIFTQQDFQEEIADCKTVDVQTTNNKTVIRTECTLEDTAVHSEAVFEGSFDTAYKATITTRYNPPLQGMSTMVMIQEARWLGPCKPGQKPGNLVMPDLDFEAGKKQLEEMMQDPKLQELLKR